MQQQLISILIEMAMSLCSLITIDGRVFDEFKTKHQDIEGYDWVDVRIEGLKNKSSSES